MSEEHNNMCEVCSGAKNLNLPKIKTSRGMPITPAIPPELKTARVCICRPEPAQLDDSLDESRVGEEKYPYHNELPRHVIPGEVWNGWKPITAYPQSEPVPEPDTIDKQQVVSVLKRLARYYDERAALALKNARRSIDARLTMSPGVPLDADPEIFDIMTAQRWQTRYQTVLKVAENLDITLSKEQPE